MRKILVGTILAPIGIKGLVILKSYMEIEKDILGFSKLYDQKGSKSFELRFKSQKKGNLIVEVSNIDNRIKAEEIKGLDLFADEAEIAKINGENEFYYKDLLGLEVRKLDNKLIGKVINVQNFGASDLLEIEYGAIVKKRVKSQKVKEKNKTNNKVKQELNKGADDKNKDLKIKVKQEYCPFTKEIIKEVDLAKGVIIVELPIGLFEDLA